MPFVNLLRFFLMFPVPCLDRVNRHAAICKKHSEFPALYPVSVYGVAILAQDYEIGQCVTPIFAPKPNVMMVKASYRLSAPFTLDIPPTACPFIGKLAYFLIPFGGKSYSFFSFEFHFSNNKLRSRGVMVSIPCSSASCTSQSISRAICVEV